MTKRFLVLVNHIWIRYQNPSWHWHPISKDQEVSVRLYLYTRWYFAEIKSECLWSLASYRHVRVSKLRNSTVSLRGNFLSDGDWGVSLMNFMYEEYSTLSLPNTILVWSELLVLYQFRVEWRLCPYLLIKVTKTWKRRVGWLRKRNLECGLCNHDY